MAADTQSRSVESELPETRDHGMEPPGPRGDNPATAGPGPTGVRSKTPENTGRHINPSPEDSNTTPNTDPKK
jgi:hypothetical protein